MRIQVLQDSAKPFRISRKIVSSIERVISRSLKLKKDLKVNVVITSPGKSKKLNKQFRHKNYIPDVLTFRYGEENSTMGEIFIVPEVVKRQAKERHHAQSDEFTILLIHGIVHMLGYEHENVSEAKKASMKRLEKKLLSQLGLTLTDRSY